MLILASQSPRRRRLLSDLGLNLDIRPVDIDESRKSGEDIVDYVSRLANEKAMASFKRDRPGDKDLVLGADTIVVLDGEVLGKPENREHARAMLHSLSDRSHHVYTGVCVLDGKGEFFCDVVKTLVRFRKLLEFEINSYLDSEEPYDKAGAYAIQGRGGVLVDQVEGSYSNVIGLPVAETLMLIDRARAGA